MGSPVGSRPTLMELHLEAKSTHLQITTLHCRNFLTNHLILEMFLFMMSLKELKVCQEKNTSINHLGESAL